MHEYLEKDSFHLQHVRRLRLEDLATSPAAAAETISGLWAWLGLSPRPELARAAAARVRPAPNSKYLSQHCASMAAEPRARAAFEKAAAELNARVRAISVTGGADGRYDLLDDEWRCAGLPPLEQALAEQRAVAASGTAGAPALKDEN